MSVLLIRWPNYWSFSFSISPSNEYSRLISFRIGWLDPFAVQGTLKSLLQHHSLKPLILQWSAFFMVQLLHPYLTTGKTIALTIWTLVGKMMSLLFNTLSQFITAFLPRSKHLLISWLDLTICSNVRARENKICHWLRLRKVHCELSCLPKGMKCILWLRVQEDRFAKSCL